MSRTRDLVKSNLNCRIEVLNQMIMTPEFPERNSEGMVLTVMENCKQIGNAGRGDLVRDSIHMLRFVQVNEKWLCQSWEWANGCQCLHVATERRRLSIEVLNLLEAGSFSRNSL